MANHLKFDAERTERLLNALKSGMTRSAAAGACGASRETLRRWVRDRPTFAALVEQAEDEAEARFTTVVAKAALEGLDWKAAIEWLRRRRKAEWSDRQELVGVAGHPEPVITIRYVNDWRKEQQPPLVESPKGNGVAKDTS